MWSGELGSTSWVTEGASGWGYHRREGALLLAIWN